MVIEKAKVGIGMEMGELWGRVRKDWDEVVGHWDEVVGHGRRGDVIGIGFVQCIGREGGAFAFEVCGSQLRVGFFRSCQIAILGLRTTLPCVLLRHASC